MINQINVEDLCYLAGFFDADGSVIAQFIFHDDYSIKNPWEIRTSIQITQKTTRFFILEEFVKIVGAGRATERKKGAVSDFILQEPANLIKFLTMLKPYLRLKKEQAELMIEIIKKREIYQNKTKKEPI